jgi:hypothetical protein
MKQTAATRVSEGRPVRATLTFTAPLAVETFRDFVSTHHLLVYSSNARAWFGEGQLGEMGLPPEFETNPNGQTWLFHPKPGGNPIDPDILASAVENRDFLGIVSTEVDLDQAAFERVIGDSRVAVVDVLKQLMIDEIHDYYPFASNEKIFVSQSMMYDVWERTRLGSAVSGP